MSGPTITQVRRALSLLCRVEVDIRAPADTIWRLLTDAEGFPRWNATVARIEGRIREGERLRIQVPGTTRTFSPRVSDVVPNRGMVWSGGLAGVFKGVRTFKLTPHANGSTQFTMEERFSGLVFALVRSSMPDFGPIFERYASDLKREAEQHGS